MRRCGSRKMSTSSSKQLAKTPELSSESSSPTTPNSTPQQLAISLLSVCRNLQHQLRPLLTLTGAVVIIDSVNNLSSAIPQSLATFLSSLLTPVVSIVAVYHTDVPLVLPKSFNEYEPHPMTILSHLATAILRISSLQQEIERQKARNRSLVEPEWGLKEEREGAIVGLQDKSKAEDEGGVVVAMELRRRSGRTVAEKFILLPSKQQTSAGKTMLVTDHPMFTSPADTGDGPDEEEPESTFNLGLTEKQKKDRDGIVLPYFDAQTDIGAGEGGRILYEMGREDDFDDEEDEI